jgi:hypothetical protein
MRKKIFISIASYRDKQLIPTIKDCLKKAKRPDDLSFGICWQHDEEDDSLLEFKNDNKFKILDVNYKDSNGACWARNSIQNLYDGEKYYLQLDSHHRFLPQWDDTLIKMISELDSNKPLLTGYCTVLDITNDQKLDNNPLKIVGCEDFSQDGNLMLKPHYIDDFKNLNSPIPARFVSGHFVFVDGKWIEDCRYDPELYFHGEEISLSIRSYTKGYDLFHPHFSIIWHEYIRSGNKKHWDDHNQNNPWWMLDSKAKKRLRKLLRQENNEEELGFFDVGKQRDFHEYELYTGIDFRNKKVGVKAKKGSNPYLMSEEEWLSDFNDNYNLNISWDVNEIETKDDCNFWFFGIEDQNNNLLFREDFGLEKDFDFMNKKKSIKHVSFSSNSSPHHVVIWPHSSSQGWLKKYTKNIR